MQIDWIYRDAVLVGTSATSLMLICATLPDDVQRTPPPPRHSICHHFVRAGLRRAQIQHIDRFQPSSYQMESNGLCRAQDPMGCRLIGSTETLCRLELPPLHCCLLVQPCLIMSKDPPPPPDTP